MQWRLAAVVYPAPDYRGVYKASQRVVARVPLWAEQQRVATSQPDKIELYHKLVSNKKSNDTQGFSVMASYRHYFSDIHGISEEIAYLSRVPILKEYIRESALTMTREWEF